MKKFIFSMLLVLASFASAAAATVKASDYTLDPPYWWTGMACDTLQIMAYGPGIADAQLTMKPYDGVNVIETVALDSKDYLLVYLDINDNARPGQLEFKFKVGKNHSTRNSTSKHATVVRKIMPVLTHPTCCT